MQTNVTCEICGKAFKRITPTHLKAHNITIKEYQIKYPEAELVSEYTKSISTPTLERLISKYGEVEGKKRWDEYRHKQAISNTFEYKHCVHGMTREQFDEYNQSRASTLANFVSRYGNINGRKKWKDYIQKQSVAGVTQEWFVQKHGIIKGQEIWVDLCKKKAHTLETYINRYGDIRTATEELERYWSSRKGSSDFVSALSQTLFDKLTENTNKENLYYWSHSGYEYGKWIHSLGKYVCLDFYDANQNICVEFLGDYWHCNPKHYTESYVHPHMKITAREVWDRDKERDEALQAQYGVSIINVWEKDYLEAPDIIVRELRNRLNYD